MVCALMACYVLEISECKPWPNFHQGLVVYCNCLRQSGVPHYPGLHPLISGSKKPSREAYWWDSHFAQGQVWNARMVKSSHLVLLI
jgi:hypothetical protein